MIDEFIWVKQPNFSLNGCLYWTHSCSNTILSNSSGGPHVDVRRLWRRRGTTQPLHFRSQRVHTRKQRHTSHNGQHKIRRWCHFNRPTAKTSSITERVTTRSDSEALTSPSTTVDRPATAFSTWSSTEKLTRTPALDKRLDSSTTPWKITVIIN